MTLFASRLRWLSMVVALVMFYVNLQGLVKGISFLSLPDLAQDFVAVNYGENSIGQLPDWRIITDCSTYNTDCATHAQNMGRYKDYPFQFKKETYEKYNWESLTELPTKWRDSMENHAFDINETIELNDYYVYPQEIFKSKATACFASAEKMSFQEQLEMVLKQIGRSEDLSMVSYTISDYNYAFDMIHDVFEMAWDVVGFQNSFFMVALDRATVELACRYGYPVVAGPGALAPDGNLKSKVANTKFKVSHQLVECGQSFFFFEMDVFFLKSPKLWLSNQTADLIISSHQNNLGAPNIGVFSVIANDATREFFQLCLDWTEVSPSTHDQFLMSQVWWVSEQIRRGEKPNLSQSEWDPAPEVPSFKHHVKVDLFGPHQIVSSEWIVPTEETIAVHPLCVAPLRSPHGKKMVVKELGAWYGFRGPNALSGYYHRKQEHRRYLWIDGRILGGYSTVMKGEDEWGLYHGEPALQLTIAVAVALARRTKRILVLPKLIHDRGTYFLWTELDLLSLEGLVEIRETNFPSNPKSWYSPSVPFKTVARTALGGDGRLFAELPLDGGVQTWKMPNIKVAVDAFFATTTAVPEISEAEALLVNPYFLQNRYKDDLFYRSKTNGLTEIEKEIMAIYKKLRWCNKGVPVVDKVASVTTSEWDCYGKGEKTKHQLY